MRLTRFRWTICAVLIWGLLWQNALPASATCGGTPTPTPTPGGVAGVATPVTPTHHQRVEIEHDARDADIIVEGEVLRREGGFSYGHLAIAAQRYYKGTGGTVIEFEYFLSPCVMISPVMAGRGLFFLDQRGDQYHLLNSRYLEQNTTTTVTDTIGQQPEDVVHVSPIPFAATAFVLSTLVGGLAMLGIWVHRHRPRVQNE